MMAQQAGRYYRASRTACRVRRVQPGHFSNCAGLVRLLPSLRFPSATRCTEAEVRRMTIVKLLPAPFVKRGAVLLCLHDEANARRSQLDGGAAMSLSKNLCCSVLFPVFLGSPLFAKLQIFLHQRIGRNPAAIFRRPVVDIQFCFLFFDKSAKFII